MKKISLLSVLTSLSMFSPFLAQAACTVNGREVPCSQFPWWIFIVIFVVLIAIFVFWIMMLVHAIKNPIQNKAIWIICMIIFGIIASVIYYFAVKQSFDRSTQITSPIN